MTGLRRGELAALRWEDIEPIEDGELHVVHAHVVVDYRVIESEPKTDKSKRTIGLDPATVAALRSHRARQAQERLAAGSAWQGENYVFANELGRPYHPQRLTIMFAQRARAAGLPVVKLHALRHGHATAGIVHGVPLKVMSERLGHSSIRITADTYAHVSPATDKAAAAGIALDIDGAL